MMKGAIMLAYHNDPAIKRTYLTRVRAHRKADEIIHGMYWERGKGCAVGCTIHDSQHSRYETELGIPRILARLEDRIFEGMSNGLAKELPGQFLSAIKVGSDLSNIWNQFAYWLLIDEQDGVIRFAKKEATKAVILTVGELYGRAAMGETIDVLVWRKVRAAAYAAADAAADAAAAAAAYAAADDAARQQAYVRMAAKLIQLLKAAPVKKGRRP